MYDNSPSTDAAFWDVKFWANATPDINRYNDTIHLRQELSNYYSYDDGSAEAGYGLNAAGAKLAYRYDLIGADSLRAIRMYFNPMANQPPSLPPDEGSFLLTVWTSLNPEVIQHQNFSFSSPEYRMDGIDKFVEYELDSVIRVEGTIYIGWTQTNAAAMNIGFDRNRNNKTKIFYKTGNSFNNTSFNGSLMMRPVMLAEPILGPVWKSRRCGPNCSSFRILLPKISVFGYRMEYQLGPRLNVWMLQDERSFAVRFRKVLLFLRVTWPPDLTW